MNKKGKIWIDFVIILSICKVIIYLLSSFLIKNYMWLLPIIGVAMSLYGIVGIKKIFKINFIVFSTGIIIESVIAVILGMTKFTAILNVVCFILITYLIYKKKISETKSNKNL